MPMASFYPILVLVGVILIGSIIPSAQSLTCTSQKFENNRSFAHCQDLPHLNAFLHWTFHSKTSSLSLAFLAAPSRPAGWVAWAFNPTATGMAGSQALLASLSGTTPSVHTFNISSYSAVVPSPTLSFPVSDLSAVFSAGRCTIFATLKVPPGSASLNQVWQVGPAFDSATGIPSVHDFKPANLNARSVLVFDESLTAPSPAPRALGGASRGPAPASAGGNDTVVVATSAPGPAKSGDAGIRTRNLGFLVGLFVFVWGIVVF